MKALKYIGLGGLLVLFTIAVSYTHLAVCRLGTFTGLPEVPEEYAAAEHPKKPHSFVSGGQAAHGLRCSMVVSETGQTGSQRENGGNRGGAGYLPGLFAIKQRRADCFGKIGTTGLA